jgi:Flp pilus assembly protein TadG
MTGPMASRPALAARARSADRGSADRGALTLSYVAVLPFMFLFIMVVIQASFWFLAREAALAAARQGADAARALGGSAAAGPAAALAFARQSGAGYLLSPVASTSGSSVNTVSVTVSGRVPSFVPGLVVRVSETVQVPVEKFRP